MLHTKPYITLITYYHVHLCFSKPKYVSSFPQINLFIIYIYSYHMPGKKILKNSNLKWSKPLRKIAFFYRAVHHGANLYTLLVFRVVIVEIQNDSIQYVSQKTNCSTITRKHFWCCLWAVRSNGFQYDTKLSEFTNLQIYNKWTT